MNSWILGLCVCAVVACSSGRPVSAGPGPVQSPSPSPAHAASASPGVRLSAADSSKIGRKIWQNESGGTVAGLTAWNDGEYFASLGIGHFIWYHAKRRGPFEESFPPLIRYMQTKGVKGIPSWASGGKPCPWTSRTEFLRDKNSPRMKALRAFLANTIPHQTAFIVKRLEAALPKMQAAVPAAQRPLVRDRFYAVASSPQGVYALIDYVNFKGEGTNPKERYKGQGWGMLQVLLEMKTKTKGAAAAADYSSAAKRVLSRRVRNAPASRNEGRWIKGWHNRCASYARPL